MRLYAISLVMSIVLALSGGPEVAYAATISSPALHLKAFKADDKVSRTWPTDPVLCDLVLDGDIAVGDADELERQFKAIEWGDGFSFFLCLRSSGGDVSEALKIAKLVLKTQRPSITTVVEDGQLCASACALIFLAGNAPAARGALPLRFLHPRGRLLFHSSRLDFSRLSDEELRRVLAARGPDGRGPKEKIADLYKEGLRDVQSVIATFQNFEYQREDNGDRWVRPSLFLEMFSQDPDEWICVDTVDAVGRWNIQVFGYQLPKVPSNREYYNACQNAYTWRSDGSIDEAEGLDANEISKLKIKRLSKSANVAGHRSSTTFVDERYSLPFQAPMARMTCVIE